MLDPQREKQKGSLDSSPNSAKKLVNSLKQVIETPWAFVASSSMDDDTEETSTVVIC